MIVFKVHLAVYTEVITAKIQPNARACGYFPQSFDKSTPFKWVFVIRTCLCLGVDLFPFFFVVGAFATGASAAVTCRPSDARALSKSTSFGTFSECHKSKNSVMFAISSRMPNATPVSPLTFLHHHSALFLARLQVIPEHHSHLPILSRPRHEYISVFLKFFYGLWRFFPRLLQCPYRDTTTSVGLAPNLSEKVGFGPKIEVMLQMHEYGRQTKIMKPTLYE